MFLKIPLNAFFDVLDVNFCPPRIRSRPRHFPRLKTQITSSWENRLSWATSSRGAIPIENLAHFHEQPARQTAEYSRLNGEPGFKAGNRLAFQPRKLKSTFSTEQKQTDLQRQKRPDFTLRKMSENGRLSVRRVLVYYTSGPPSVPRRGCARGGASVASLRTPQTSTRLSTAKSMDCPALLLVLPSLRKQSGGAGSRADPLASLRAFRPLFAFRLSQPGL